MQLPVLPVLPLKQYIIRVPMKTRSCQGISLWASAFIVRLGCMQDRWASIIVTCLARKRCVVTVASPATLCIGKLFVTAPMPWFLFFPAFPTLCQFITLSRLMVLICEPKLSCGDCRHSITGGNISHRWDYSDMRRQIMVGVEDQDIIPPCM